MTRCCVRWCLFLGLLACRAGFPSAHAAPDATAGLYRPGTTLVDTLQTAREGFQTWTQTQRTVGAVVDRGPWYFAAPGTGPQLTTIDLTRPVDFDAKASNGQPLWANRPDFKDGQVRRLSTERGSNVRWLAARVLKVREPGTFYVGLGGGQRLIVWLNEQRLAEFDTTVNYQRYGTGQMADRDRRDQVLCPLPLTAGDNRLVVEVFQDSVGDGRPLEFCFSASPNPVHELWRRVRADFPPSTNRLLQRVSWEWFTPSGWLAQPDGLLQQKFLDETLKALGPQAAPVQKHYDALRAANTPPLDRRWLELCVQATDLQTAIQEMARLRQVVEELARDYPDTYPHAEFLGRLGVYQRQWTTVPPTTADAEDRGRSLLTELDAMKRLMLVEANPLLRGQQLLLVKRFTYDSQHYYDDYYHGPRAWGGNLYVVSLADGQAREIVPELRGGIFDRYDLSFDAQRIVFGYRAPKPTGYRLYEVGIAGRGLRQLTYAPDDEEDRVDQYSTYPRDELKKNPLLYGHWTDDLHPCYLPDGRIVFSSSRCEHSVLCGGHKTTATNLYRIDADGGNLTRLSHGALGEFTPTMMEDGRLLYNRWEYVYKGIAAIQPLWSMRPDGSGSEEVYGDNIANPGVFIHGRQVPTRPNLIVASGVAHEPLAVGAIYLLNLHRDKRTESVMTSLTPDTKVEGLRGLYQRRNDQWRRDDVYGPFYCDPYPLADAEGRGAGKFFLVACNPDKRYNDPLGYGIYLLDVFGNLTPVYRDETISCWEPMILAPRRTPPVLSSLPPPATLSQKTPPKATLLLADVYRGLDGIKPGTVKYLRILRQIPRPWSVHRTAAADDGVAGQMVAVSWFTHIWVAVLEGIVPVHEDGSAYFQVPADENLFFQALDENFMEVQVMRTFINLRPGESRSCIGCHERRQQSPLSQPVLALCEPAVRPGPQPGETAPRPLHYPSDVQPVLDRHCVRCHQGEKAGGGLDLSGTLTEHFSRSYESLLQKKLVETIREWAGPDFNGNMMHAPAVAPYTYGSHRSKLISLLRQGHYDVQLPREDFVKLVTWIDANAPYYGSYFGRRNLRYKDQPDFRPVPTLTIASGHAPQPWEPEPVPAVLAAHWRLDEGQGNTARDASGGGHDGRIVGGVWTTGPAAGKALNFKGDNYVAVENLGRFETLSLALWVRADALRDSWNPLLFRDQWTPSALHVSLLGDGAVNVALHGAGVIHQRSRGTVGDGSWHHVAVVLDLRPGGSVQFYLDGRRDRKRPLTNALPAMLDRARLGAWDCWQGSPQNNFHGALSDVRIYRGQLTDQQVAELAALNAPAAEKKP